MARTLAHKMEFMNLKLWQKEFVMYLRLTIVLLLLFTNTTNALVIDGEDLGPTVWCSTTGSQYNLYFAPTHGADRKHFKTPEEVCKHSWGAVGAGIRYSVGSNVGDLNSRPTFVCLGRDGEPVSNEARFHPGRRFNKGCTCGPGTVYTERNKCSPKNGNPNLGMCPSSNQGPSSSVGNPINAATGNKYQREVDTNLSSIGLQFYRNYNSRPYKNPYEYRTAIFQRNGTVIFHYDEGEGQRSVASFIGNNWQHNFSSKVTGTPYHGTVIVHRADGNSFNYKLENGLWVSAADKQGKLIMTGDTNNPKWEYVTREGNIEAYLSNGNLASVTDATGLTTKLDYHLPRRDANPETLDRITGPFGHQLNFTYVNGRVDSLKTPDGKVTKYSYDDSNRLLSVTYPAELGFSSSREYHYENPMFPNALTGITDENGNRFASYAYDLKGRAISSEHGEGIDKVSLIYDSLGTKVIHANGRQNTYRFADPKGVNHKQVESIEGEGCTSCGSSEAITHDGNGFIESKTDFNGNITKFVHDETGLELSRTEAFGSDQERTITTEWDANLRKPLAVVEPGKTTTYSYSTLGQLLKRVEVDQATGEQREHGFSYTYSGKLSRITLGAAGATRQQNLAYDQQSNLIRSINALGHVTLLTSYDAAGRLLEFSSPNGAVTQLSYDARGRLIKSETAGASTQYQLDAVGNIIKVTKPDGSVLRYGYDIAHRLISVEDSSGNKITYTLDDSGNRIQQQIDDEVGLLAQIHSTIYDDLNRITEVANASNEVQKFEYDLNGNLTKRTNALGHISRSQFDALNRLSSSVDALNGSSQFTYNQLDQLRSVTDPNGNTTHYEYNAFGDLVRQTSPDTGVTTHTYNDFGDRTSTADAKNIVASYQYDKLGRLLSTTYLTAEANTSYVYDICTNGIGRVCAMQYTSGTTSFNYDLQGNVVEKVKTQALASKL